jgi:hypothetical protein
MAGEGIEPRLSALLGSFVARLFPKADLAPILSVTSTVMGMINEERILSAAFPEYRA